MFFVVLFSNAFFWHTRDWNTASRLMLTYAIVDRGTVSISGLDRQTGDKAKFHGAFYSDKLPGYPVMATVPYWLARKLLRLPPHPLDHGPIPYWPADYWTTVGTSGLLTACTAALLVAIAVRLGCGPRRAGLIGLAYALATPAYIYATLAYGHQAAAFALVGSFWLLWLPPTGRNPGRLIAAGLLASYAAVIELQVGPVSAILGLYLIAQCACRKRSPEAIGFFGVGAVIPALLLLGYNQLAFGSPFDMGYFHHDTRQFAEVHSAQNPLGLTGPDWRKLAPLLWGDYRGLFFHAPVLALAIPGWFLLFARKRLEAGIVSLFVVIAVLLVNLSYPEWTGGWSTGPRLLVPLLPFAMIPVAALLAGGSRLARIAALAAVLLAVAGGAEMLLFQGVGGRIPQFVAHPLRDGVWPLWISGGPLPPWRFGVRFSENLVSLAAPEALQRLDPRWQTLQFLPLVGLQAVAIVAIFFSCRPVKDVDPAATAPDCPE